MGLVLIAIGTTTLGTANLPITYYKPKKKGLSF